MVHPSFTVAEGQTVFGIGSCFARNIEEYVEKIGIHAPMSHFSVPQAEIPYHRRTNGILNKFTPASIAQELRWTESIYERDGCVRPDDVANLAYDVDGGYIDNGLCGFFPVSWERLLARRQEVFDTIVKVFSADCVVITLGLIEAWYDRERGRYIEEAPIGNKNMMRQLADSVVFKRLTYEQCREAVQAAIDCIRRHNPDANIMLTTSPVPMKATFTDDDVVLANMQSKSMLRTVAGVISEDNTNVDYFPSYEIIKEKFGHEAYEGDWRHVKDQYVGYVVKAMLDHYADTQRQGGWTEIARNAKMAEADFAMARNRYQEADRRVERWTTSSGRATSTRTTRKYWDG